MGLPTIQLLLGFWRRIAPQFVQWVVSTLKPKDGAKDQHQERKPISKIHLSWVRNHLLKMQNKKQKGSWSTRGRTSIEYLSLHSQRPLTAAASKACSSFGRSFCFGKIQRNREAPKQTIRSSSVLRMRSSTLICALILYALWAVILPSHGDSSGLLNILITPHSHDDVGKCVVFSSIFFFLSEWVWSNWAILSNLKLIH